MGCFLKRVSLGILLILIAKTFAQGATDRLVHPGFFMRTASPASGSFLVPSAAMQTAAPGPVSYAYDELGRLIAVFDANGNAAVYNYDAVGNILSIARYASTQASAFSFSPTHGSPGTQVTIYGTGFSTTPGQNTVQFNGATAAVATAAANQLVVTVPNAATTGPISVTSPAGSVTSPSNFTITAATASPIITSFSPNIAAVGTSLTINGANFDPVAANNRLRINNVSWSPVSASTTTTLTTTIPPLTGSGRVALYTPSGDVISQGDLFIPFGTLAVSDIGYTARMAIGGSQTVTLAPNKTALILFDAVAGQKISVQVTNSTFVSPSVYVILPDSTMWIAGSPSIPSIALPVTGTYTLGIVGGSAGGSATVQLGTDVLGTIAIDGPAVTVTTTIPGQDARLVFNAPVHAGQQIVLWATNVTNPTATILLVGPTGEPQPLVPTNSFIINNNPPGHQFFLDQQTLLGSGTYTVWVQHSGTNVGSETLQIASAPDFVVPIVPGGPAVRIPATGDTIIGENGRLTFSGLSGQKVSMIINGGTYPPAANSCLVSLKSPTSVIVSQGWNCGLGANTFVDSTTLNESGRYTVLVDPQGQSTGHTNVQLYAFSDATGTVAIDGPAVTATTTVPGQDARYTFSATAGQRVVLRIANVTNPSASVHILKPDGTTQVDMGVINNNPSGQTFFLDTQTLAAAGNYTIFVQHSGANVGSEQLQVTSAPDILGTIAIDGAAVRVPASGSTVLGQDARLTFNATAGQRIALQVTNVTNPSVTVNLLKPDGTTQASLSISNAPGQVWLMDTQTLATAGTYMLWVKHGGTNTGSETLQLSSVPADISLPITIGGAAVRAPASGNTAVGQNATLSFTATAGQKVSLSISTTFASSTCTLSIKAPNGGGLTVVTCQTPYVDTLTLSLTGTYSIFVDPQGTATGNITVQLNDNTPLTGTIAIDGAAVRVPASGSTSIGQDAQYTFSASAGQRVALQATSVTNPGATVLLLKPDGTTQASVSINNSPAGQTFFLDTQTLVTAGTYSLLVRHVWTNAGSETLQLISVPADDTGTLTINGAAVRIPAAGSTALGQNATRTFSATAGQSLKINLSNTTFPQNTCLLTLKNPSGGTVTSGACGINGSTVIAVTVATAGTYTITIDPQGTSTGSISISVTSP